ncbi:unnamed protein product [Camellia sinensis]
MIRTSRDHSISSSSPSHPTLASCLPLLAASIIAPSLLMFTITTLSSPNSLSQKDIRLLSSELIVLEWMICKSLLLHTFQPMTMPMRKDMDKDRPQWCKSVFSVLSVSFFSIMKKWKGWESDTSSLEYQFTNDPARFRFSHQTSFVRRHTRFSRTPGIRWIVAFSRQFFGSVSKVEYITMRNGFINFPTVGFCCWYTLAWISLVPLIVSKTCGCRYDR